MSEHINTVHQGAVPGADGGLDLVDGGTGRVERPGPALPRGGGEGRSPRTQGLRERPARVSAASEDPVAARARALVETLTEREREVAVAVSGGGSNADIARELAAMEQIDEPAAQEKILEILRKAAAIYNKDKVPA